MSLEDILKSQKEFFYSDATMPVGFRLLQLCKLKNSLIKNQNELYTALYEDLEKSHEDTLSCEIGPCIKEINFFIKNLKSLCKPKRVRTSLINFKSKGYIYKKPFGVCLIISSWNYPILLSLLPLIGALASGNTCILKLHPLSKNTNKVIEKILFDTFERCYVKCVDGDKDTLDFLLSLDFDHIFATGNSNFGKYLYSKAGEKLIPVTLELGGKNPCIVHKDANLKLCCKRIVHGKFLNAGQTCLAPDYILVHKSIKDRFIELITETTTNMYSKNVLNFPHYSKIINEEHFNRLVKIIDTLKSRVIYGGNYDKDTLKISPTIIDTDGTYLHELEQEIFGPILDIKSYEIIDDVIYSLKQSPAPLALYLFSKNKILINKCLDIPFGGGCINDTVIHMTEQNIPFGGFRNSGIGNYHGIHSFNTFTNKKGILFKSNRIDVNLRYPNNKNYNFKTLKSIFRIK